MAKPRFYIDKPTETVRMRGKEGWVSFRAIETEPQTWPIGAARAYLRHLRETGRTEKAADITEALFARRP